jgi:nucleoside-diphosphate-sugar epimerase
MSPHKPTRVAITGAAGFLGRSMARVIGDQFPVRLFDVVPVPGEWEDSRVGDVARLEDVMSLCEGCSDLVIGHMAPNRPEIYGTPTMPFDINVKGTANLFHAADAHGIKRVVLISSIAAVQAHYNAGKFLARDLPWAPLGMYPLTKALQEQIAQCYHRTKKMEIAVLRPAYICDEDSVSDKYGRKSPTVNWQFIDPRDIAQAARLALVVPELGYEVFYLLGHPDAEAHADMKHLREFLGWKAQHTFEKYPRDGEVPGT